MAAELSRRTLYSGVHANVFETLKENLRDPATGSLGNTRRKWIYTRRPDVKSLSFSNYPFVVVMPSKVGENVGQSLDLSKANLDFEVQIEIHSSDRGTGNQTGLGAQYLDEISDQVHHIFTDAGVRRTLANNGISNVRITGEVADVIEEHNETVFFRPFTFAARSRLRVGF